MARDTESRYTRYWVTARLSVAADQLKSTRVLSTRSLLIVAGADGAVVSGVEELVELLDLEELVEVATLEVNAELVEVATLEVGAELVVLEFSAELVELDELPALDGFALDSELAPATGCAVVSASVNISCDQFPAASPALIP